MADSPLIPYQASKWIDLNLFLSSEEFDSFLPNAHYVKASGIHAPDAIEYSREEVLALYPKLPPFFLTESLEAITTQTVAPEKVIVKPRFPLIQCQEHVMTYSRSEKKFRSMVRGPDAISWGIHLSFPQLFEDPKTHEVINTSSLPNGKLFRFLQKWARQHTRPTPVIIDGEKEYLTARIGNHNLDQAQQLGMIIDE